MGFFKAHVRTFVLIAVIIAVFFGFTLWQNTNTFDQTEYDVKKVMAHVEELTSETYMGKQAGSKGNALALNYIETFFKQQGIKPAGENDTYFQPFNTVMPAIDTNPTFTLADENGNILNNFIMYQDYNAMPIMNGGSIDFSGDIYIAANRLKNIEPELLAGKVVVVENFGFTSKIVSYVKASGGVGVLCCSDNRNYGRASLYEQAKMLSATGRTDDPMLVGYISKATYNILINNLGENEVNIRGQETGEINNITLNISMDFPVVSTANVLGQIKGKVNNGRVLLISANLDGMGESINGAYFPGANRDTSGIAALLETARVVAAQDNLPYQTIVFAGWNAQHQQLSGVEYYLAQPLFDLDKTTVIHLDALGEPTREGLKIASDNINSTILKSKIANYGKEAELTITEMNPLYNSVSRFADKGCQAVLLTDRDKQKRSHADTIETVDESTVENSVNVLLTFIKRSVYKDTKIDYLNQRDMWFILVFLFGLMLNYIIKSTYRKDPNTRLGALTTERIYFSKPATLLRKLYAFLLPTLIGVFLIVLLANINQQADIMRINNQTITNLSGYLTIKKSVLYIKNLPQMQLGNVKTANSLIEVIVRASKSSLLLLGSSLVLSTILGVAKGIFDAYKTKRKTLRSFSTMVMFSVPDVLIVLLGLLLYVSIAKQAPQAKDVLPLNKFVLPLITLSIIPTIYIARITFIAIQDEIKKDYIANAKAKGFGKFRLFYSELLPPIMFKVVDTMPSIMTMMLSNMIIVEYLFNYLGIVYYLLYFYNRQDADRFVALAIVLGIIYILFTLGIQLIAMLINPLKREVKE